MPWPKPWLSSRLKWCSPRVTTSLSRTSSFQGSCLGSEADADADNVELRRRDVASWLAVGSDTGLIGSFGCTWAATRFSPVLGCLTKILRQKFDRSPQIVTVFKGSCAMGPGQGSGRLNSHINRLHFMPILAFYVTLTSQPTRRQVAPVSNETLAHAVGDREGTPVGMRVWCSTRVENVRDF